MTWQVFGGEYHELYFAILCERYLLDGIDINDAAAVNRQFRLHLHRGIGYLATPNRVRSVADLMLDEGNAGQARKTDGRENPAAFGGTASC